MTHAKHSSNKNTKSVLPTQNDMNLQVHVCARICCDHAPVLNVKWLIHVGMTVDVQWTHSGRTVDATVDEARCVVITS